MAHTYTVAAYIILHLRRYRCHWWIGGASCYRWRSGIHTCLVAYDYLTEKNVTFYSTTDRSLSTWSQLTPSSVIKVDYKSLEMPYNQRWQGGEKQEYVWSTGLIQMLQRADWRKVSQTVTLDGDSGRWLRIKLQSGYVNVGNGEASGFGLRKEAQEDTLCWSLSRWYC